MNVVKTICLKKKRIHLIPEAVKQLCIIGTEKVLAQIL